MTEQEFRSRLEALIFEARQSKLDPAKMIPELERVLKNGYLYVMDHSGVWKQYRSHKVVQAAAITEIANEDGIVTLYVGAHERFIPSQQVMADNAYVGDYAIRYEDDYRSVSPRRVFEDGYTAIA